VGFVADTLGPRWSLVAGAASGFLAALVGVRAVARLRAARKASEA
jgi:hypothetical protein